MFLVSLFLFEKEGNQLFQSLLLFELELPPATRFSRSIESVEEEDEDDEDEEALELEE